MGDFGQKMIDLSRGKKKKPKPKPAIVMPDEEQLKLEKRRKAARRFGPGAGSGRASTVLSNTSQTLGG